MTKQRMEEMLRVLSNSGFVLDNPKDKYTILTDNTITWFAHHDVLGNELSLEFHLFPHLGGQSNDLEDVIFADILGTGYRFYFDKYTSHEWKSELLQFRFFLKEFLYGTGADPEPKPPNRSDLPRDCRRGTPTGSDRVAAGRRDWAYRDNLLENQSFWSMRFDKPALLIVIDFFFKVFDRISLSIRRAITVLGIPRHAWREPFVILKIYSSHGVLCGSFALFKNRPLADGKSFHNDYTLVSFDWSCTPTRKTFSASTKECEELFRVMESFLCDRCIHFCEDFSGCRDCAYTTLFTNKINRNSSTSVLEITRLKGEKESISSKTHDALKQFQEQLARRQR